jgi:hypothetical protein
MAKCMKCGGMKYKTGGSTMKTTVGSASPKGLIFGIPNGGPTGPNKQGIDTMKNGGSKLTAVKHSCPPGTVRSATGGCVSERPSFKKGGSTKSFPDFNKDKKITKADILIGRGVVKKTVVKKKK